MAQRKAISVALLRTWLVLGIVVYALVLLNGAILLGDSDTYWHLAVGQWIIDHGALPRTDIYSFTRAGAPWISTEWLSQGLYAAAYDAAGWAGPIILAAPAIGSAFALFTYILGSRLPAKYAVVVALAALLVSVSHLFARPHVLVLPVMIAWVHGLMRASERGQAPSYWLLPLLVFGARLHGGFAFGWGV